MKREENDKHIRHKTDSVTRLPEGDFNTQAAWERLASTLPPEKRRAFAWQPYGIAAGLLLLVATAFYLWPSGGEEHRMVNEAGIQHEISPAVPPVAKPDTEVVIVKRPTLVKTVPFTKTAVSPSVQNVLPAPEDTPVVAEVEVPMPLQPKRAVQVPQNIVAVHINELADEPIKQPEIPKAGFIGKVYAASGTSSKQSNLSDEDMQYGLLNLGINR